MIHKIDLLGMYVANLRKTVAFYKELGFESVTDVHDEREPAYVTAGDMRLQFIAAKTAEGKAASFQRDAFSEHKGEGLYINVRVDDVDAVYASLQKQHIATSGEPRDWPWGQREFVVRDPDGYKLVFYQVL